MKIIIHTDGGSRGNPGKAGIGVTINAEKIIFHHRYIGIQTNNYAEYTAVLDAYNLLEKNFLIGELEFFMDSELVMKQLTGEYKIKNQELKKIYDQIKIKETKYPKILYSWIPREKNHVADSLANKAMDER